MIEERRLKNRIVNVSTVSWFDFDNATI